MSGTRIFAGAAAVVMGFNTITFGGEDRMGPSDPNATIGAQTESVGTQVSTSPAPNGLDLTQPIYLQLANPADNARDRAAAAQQSAPAAIPPQTLPRLRSYELPAIEVVGQAPGLKEEELVGSYEQPRWTADRRFPSTRIYVLPEGTAEFEFWLRPTSPRHGGTELRSLAELELGLPYRLQLDLYLRSESMSGSDAQVGESVELRYALADWNKIWGNPTFYLEWSRLEDESDSIEVKLLLGGEIAPRLHWGLNLSDELATGGERENEIEVTGGVSCVLTDSRFSVGAETECGIVDAQNHRGTYNDNFFFVGPSFQYRPSEQTHIDFTPMAGLGHENPSFRAYVVIGYEF